MLRIVSSTWVTLDIFITVHTRPHVKSPLPVLSLTETTIRAADKQTGLVTDAMAETRTGRGIERTRHRRTAPLSDVGEESAMITQSYNPATWNTPNYS